MAVLHRSKICCALLLVQLIFCNCSVESENDRASKVTSSAEPIPYESPNIQSTSVYFAEHFDNIQEFRKKWVLSKSKKPGVSKDLAQYDGKWDVLPLERFPLKGDTGLVLISESRHAAIVSKFNKPFVFDKSKKFIVQYVVAFQKNVDCGGAYLKLLTEGALQDLSLFNDKTPYTIMFGPDKCGGVGKLHFIIRHMNPLNGTITEKHCTKLKVDDNMYKDHEPYLLKLLIEPDNNFAVYINNDLQYQGNLLDADTFNPPVNPPKEIIDESDVKPDDWDDRLKINDPNAVKPEDWNENEPAEIPDPNTIKPEGWLDDEPLTIPDESATKPQDWDDEMDGEWEPPSVENPICKEVAGCGPWTPPMVENPKFKGKWKPPMIDNPNYKGKWVPRKIPNPDYFYDDAPLKSSPIGYVGFELWTLVNNMYFDDILVTDSEEVSHEWTEKTWRLKKQSIAAESVTWKGRTLRALNYNPGWWVVYGLYCAIPVAVYILYMRNVIQKASFYRMFLEYTNNYPWLWAVYVLVLAVLVGFIGTCCLRLRRNKDDFERDTLHKKTDDYLPEDDIDRIVESHQSGTVDDLPFEEAGNTESKLISDGTAVKNLDDEETDPEEKLSRPSSEEEEDAKISEIAKEKEMNSPPTSSPRKRKPRRD